MWCVCQRERNGEGKPTDIEMNIGEFALNNDTMPEMRNERIPLNDYHGNKHIERNTAVRIFAQKRHKKPEANENHDMYILKHAISFEGTLQKGKRFKG